MDTSKWALATVNHPIALHTVLHSMCSTGALYRYMKMKSSNRQLMHFIFLNANAIVTKYECVCNVFGSSDLAPVSDIQAIDRRQAVMSYSPIYSNQLRNYPWPNAMHCPNRVVCSSRRGGVSLHRHKISNNNNVVSTVKCRMCRGNEQQIRQKENVHFVVVGCMFNRFQCHSTNLCVHK